MSFCHVLRNQSTFSRKLLSFSETVKTILIFDHCKNVFFLQICLQAFFKTSTSTRSGQITPLAKGNRCISSLWHEVFKEQIDQILRSTLNLTSTYSLTLHWLWPLICQLSGQVKPTNMFHVMKGLFTALWKHPLCYSKEQVNNLMISYMCYKQLIISQVFCETITVCVYP